MLATFDPYAYAGYLAGRAAGVFVLCLVVSVVTVGAVFILRDMFRSGERGIPVWSAAAIAAFFTVAGCWLAGEEAFLILPFLLTAYFLGRRKRPKCAPR